MILLLNRATVATEIMQLARYRIAGICKVPLKAVVGMWVQSESGGLSAEFHLDAKMAVGVSDELLEKVLQDVWTITLKPELDMRLAGLESRWHGQKEDQKEDND